MPGRAPAVPPIDFTRDEAVLIATGPRSSTGYALRVLRVKEQRDRVVVVVRERAPSLGDRVQARVTYPYRLIVFSRIPKLVTIDYLGRP